MLHLRTSISYLGQSPLYLLHLVTFIQTLRPLPLSSFARLCHRADSALLSNLRSLTVEHSPPARLYATFNDLSKAAGISVLHPAVHSPSIVDQRQKRLEAVPRTDASHCDQRDNIVRLLPSTIFLAHASNDSTTIHVLVQCDGVSTCPDDNVAIMRPRTRSFDRYCEQE